MVVAALQVRILATDAANDVLDFRVEHRRRVVDGLHCDVLTPEVVARGVEGRAARIRAGLRRRMHVTQAEAVHLLARGREAVVAGTAVRKGREEQRTGVSRTTTCRADGIRREQLLERLQNPHRRREPCDPLGTASGRWIRLERLLCVVREEQQVLARLELALVARAPPFHLADVEVGAALNTPIEQRGPVEVVLLMVVEQKDVVRAARGVPDIQLCDGLLRMEQLDRRAPARAEKRLGCVSAVDLLEHRVHRCRRGCSVGVATRLKDQWRLRPALLDDGASSLVREVRVVELQTKGRLVWKPAT
mmetsp:Transcript_27367/g.87892  ORF Transcript_27367/g.87892 Transcript_27367/m.87892 type:complete len:305 (-) Transcript_27367:2181-3095(-)